jgi:hypothetical protein
MPSRAHDAGPGAWWESRWPPLIALAFAALLYATLPSSLILGGGWLRWIIPGLELALIVVAAVPPVHESDRRRHVGMALVMLVAVANASAIGLLVNGIVGSSGFEGRYLIVSALQVWATNIIIFAVWFWELDGGGPSGRATAPPGPHDFLFGQYQLPGRWHWRPSFADYLYLSITNSMAFAPTDALPLRHRVKLLMALEALLSLLVVLIVAARAISIID